MFGTTEAHRAAQRVAITADLDIAARFVEFHGESEPGLDRVVGIVQVDPEVAITLFEPKGIQRLHTGVAQAQISAYRHYQIMGLHGPYGGHVQFPAQLAHEGHAVGQHPGIAHVDLLRGHEGEAHVRQSGARDPAQQVTRLSVRMARQSSSRTPLAMPFRDRMVVTRTSSKIRAPPIRGPLARDMVT